MSRGLDVLLAPLGSAGDVHPFVGLGLALKERGHQVTMITSPHFEPLARRVGLEPVIIGTSEEADAILSHPDLWHPRKGIVVMAKLVVLPRVRDVYEAIAARFIPGRTVLAASALAIGARIAHEKLGVPLVTVQPYAAVFRSAYRPPVMPGLYLRDGQPRAWKRLVYRLVDALVLDPLLAPGVNTFRAELGLPPVRRLADRWWLSPQRALGLFPEWFSPPQPDWPPQLRLTGFPLYDKRGATVLPEGLEAFLATGSPPVIFTTASANRQASGFFAESVAACRALGRRGVLLTQFAEQVPAGLPDEVRHFEYVPLSVVLPAAAALAHHGGIGTGALAMAHGVPQLISPLAHDQFDNAARIVRQGVARLLPARHYRAPAVARALDDLLGDAALARRCCEVAGRFRGVRPFDLVCREIEALAGPGPAGRTAV